MSTPPWNGCVRAAVRVSGDAGLVAPRCTTRELAVLRGFAVGALAGSVCVVAALAIGFFLCKGDENEMHHRHRDAGGDGSMAAPADGQGRPMEQAVAVSSDSDMRRSGVEALR